MRRIRHKPALPRLTDMYDQLLLLLLISHHGEELGIMNDIQNYIDNPPPVAWEIDCKEVRQAVAEGEDLLQYKKAFDLFTRTGSTKQLRKLRGIKVAASETKAE